MKTLSDKPVVFLLNSFKDPLKNVAAAAKTCYSNKGIVVDESIAFPDDESLIFDLFSSGHHTTFEHSYFQFAISNVTRQSVWSLLHSHPFYNSEQVSQRFTEVKKNNYYIPELSGEEKDKYIEVINNQYTYYKELIFDLLPVVESEYYKLFPARAKFKDKYKYDINKRSREIARYILPIASFTYLYHTISLITLIRYFVKVRINFSTEEEKYIVNSFIEEVIKKHPEFKVLFDFLSKKYQKMSLIQNNNISYSRNFKSEFDDSLLSKSSVLVDYSEDSEKTFADSIRMVFGYSKSDISDEDSISLAMDSGKNTNLADPLVMTNYFNISRTMNHIKYTFRKKISHTADSQNQRHRTTYSSKPEFLSQDFSEPDYIIPELIKIDTGIRKKYSDLMNRIWDGINYLHRKGISEEKYFYILPNAYPIRLTETGSLLNYQHKYKLRLCYNAQEEIWRNSVDEVIQIKAKHPNIGKYLLPPCAIRKNAEIAPYCSEGKRYCGIPVWKTNPENYSKII